MKATSNSLNREMARLYPPTELEQLQFRVRCGLAARQQSPAMAARPWDQPRWSDLGIALGFLACLTPAFVLLLVFG